MFSKTLRMSIEILHLLKRKRNFKGFFGANLKSRYGIAIDVDTFIKPRNNIVWHARVVTVLYSNLEKK